MNFRSARGVLKSERTSRQEIEGTRSGGVAGGGYASCHGLFCEDIIDEADFAYRALELLRAEKACPA
jgi:hypothetical protein